MATPLTEKFIQHAVADRLNGDHYRRRSAYVSTEVYTRLKRADVLLAFLRTRSSPYVVVVEAKSRNTIHQLKLKVHRGRAEWTGRLLSLALLVGLSALLGYQWYFNALNTLLLLAVFLLGSVLITAVVTWLRLRFARSISAIEQLGRYPANESWIAVGEDTFVNPAEYRILLQQCRKNGVGLIVVDARGRLSLKQIPRPRHVFNDYLSRYGRKQEILDGISRRPAYGATPAERRQNRRRFLNIALLLSLTGLLMLLVYEENYGPVVPDPFADPRFRTPADIDLEGPAQDVPTDLGPSTPAPAPAAPDCPTVEANTPTYVVVDALLPTPEAEVRLQQLAAAGMRGQEQLSTVCLVDAPGPNTVAITTGARYPSPESARHAAGNYRSLLEKLGLDTQDVQIMQLGRVE
ncbi:hypothetical protein GGR26_000222 [Lewinella marina]|uniref:Uncharacterized protein n=1 Tax=Neolewinella marina TaxID=438751 RepID=A0A2G0CK74_9BACT|nr:hypothetical protein [Neolewinella marina]NJB84477.1 hypothetical protein [Neolewinella marina]PHL00331.1 hypothetical protein CGL56_04675 [Neolewinella marina]